MTSDRISSLPTQDSIIVDSVYIQPDIRRGRITVLLAAPGDCSFRLELPEFDVSKEGAVGKNVLPMDGFELWTPETPKVYELCVTTTLPGGESETLSYSFGMREFSVKENRFFFNNRPLFVKGADCSGLVGGGVSSDDDRSAIDGCLGGLKDAGFNLIRVALSSLTPQLLGTADGLGLLVEVRVGSADELPAISQLRNHPSVVCWNVLGIADLDATGLRGLDPSRLFLYTNREEGCACCVRPYRDDHQRIESIEIAHRAPTDPRSRSYCQYAGDASMLSYVSGLDVGGAEIAESRFSEYDEGLSARELERILPAGEGVQGHVRQMGVVTACGLVDALRANVKIAGYCVRVVGDGGREASSVSEAVNRIGVLRGLAPNQAAARPLLAIAHTNLIPRQETPVTVHFLNEAKVEGRADLSLQVVGPTNQVLWKKKRGVRLPKSGKLLWEGSIAASGSTGKHRFVVRVMQDMKCIAEASEDFFVYAPVTKWEGVIHLLDPGKRWGEECARLVSGQEFTAPVHVIPPISNSIREYPDNDLAQVLGRVNEGAVALFFSPPSDWNDFASFIDPELCATPLPVNRVSPSALHYAKSHPVFDALPSRTTMDATYGQLLPRVSFQEVSEEDICGCFRGMALEDGGADWCSSILVKKYGSGRIVFVSLPIMEELGQNPVADHLFVNLIRHFVRRSVPSKEGNFSVHQRSVEWIRQQRRESVQNWALMGMFPNSPDEAKPKVYPPEESIDLDATYPGWYRALSWQYWTATGGEDFVVDLDEALGPWAACGPTSDYGIAYAYAEIVGETRGEMGLVVDSSVRAEVFLNGTLVHTTYSGEGDSRVYVKLGKNTVLVKLYKTPGPFHFRFELEERTEPVKYRWWR